MAIAGIVRADAPGGSGQVWLVSTRQARCGGPPAADALGLGYWRYQGGDQWERASAEEFLHEKSPLPTTVFIHGNQTDADKAVRDAWRVYCQMERMAAGRPFRFVIWSWSADRMLRRVRHDARLKAAYSDVEAFHLAGFLRRLDPTAPVSLMGYSFGARIITGALHLLAGGSLGGHGLGAVRAGETAVPQRAMRVVLVAAAIDAAALAPGHRNGLALTQVDQMLVTVNRCDRVLRWYPRLYGRRGPQAMGFVGPACCGAPGKTEAIDVSCSVGPIHDWSLYSQAGALVRRLAHYTFLEATGPGTSAAPGKTG